MNNEKKLKYEYKFNDFNVQVSKNKIIYYTYYLKEGFKKGNNKKTGTYMLNPKIPDTVFNNLNKNTQNKYKINNNHYLLKELKPEKYEHLSNNQKNKYMIKVNYESHPGGIGMSQKTNERYILLPKLIISREYEEDLNSTQKNKYVCIKAMIDYMNVKIEYPPGKKGMIEHTKFIPFPVKEKESKIIGYKLKDSIVSLIEIKDKFDLHVRKVYHIIENIIESNNTITLKGREKKVIFEDENKNSINKKNLPNNTNI
jgi:hypothetical protein